MNGNAHTAAEAEGVLSMRRNDMDAADANHDLRNMPSMPESLEDTGLSDSFVKDLIVKHLYRYGTLSGREIARKLCLPFLLIDPLLDELLQRVYVEKRGGQGLGNSTDKFALTDQGRKNARDLVELDTYTGPAPIPLPQYETYVRGHGLHTISVTEKKLREAWRNFILDDEMFSQIGPAIQSGKSCFIYGPPGTGKSTLAKAVARYLDEHGGHVAIPHALLVGGSLIRIYDPVFHQRVGENRGEQEASFLFPESQGDQRWVLCQRPTVIVGGELTLDMLDLRYNVTTKYYEAPLQVKANGGVFVIDDFGRQLVKPKDLLNRWIVPLEEKIDFLTLHTGKKFSIPFEQLVVFATNLNPTELVDGAFLRRIRYKMYLGAPLESTYKLIFDKECKKKKFEYDIRDVDAFLKKYYISQDRMLRACDPRDLTDLISDYCHFNDLPNRITWEILDSIAASYFKEVKA
ncbi:MAG: AAA family ATPase [Candidatus Omnitrophota bacterium]|jgi:energy-coupling factor transporter ATP-binding protein EcfA2|nr:MAG: AAA family ATPase [Candidatus Omnitrophota bacterium]